MKQGTNYHQKVAFEGIDPADVESEAYKALKGNSFIDRIYSEIKEYEIVS